MGLDLTHKVTDNDVALNRSHHRTIYRYLLPHQKTHQIFQHFKTRKAIQNTKYKNKNKKLNSCDAHL